MIKPYKDSDFDDMREFYFQILYESRHFLPYTPAMNKGLFNSENRFNFIIRDKKIVAHLTVVRVNETVFNIGVAVLRDYYGRHLGSDMLDFADNFIQSKGGSLIEASIHTDNWRSILLFVKKHYKVVKEENNLWLEKELSH